MARTNDSKCGRGTKRAVVIVHSCDAAVTSRGTAMSQQYRVISIGNGGSVQQYSSNNTGNSNGTSIGASTETTSDNTNNHSQVEGMIK
ncbi:hypothetical protein DMN91_001732 [Ooceraea biroi]|uniref:Uncharacterized protein n=1 Tax=Ooceraea biroi TaxID=2015173 RepID=A0A026W9C6_OOCBI|nr:uncharacterized protein LOC113561501 [Ooceraea biroi]EZA52593.1 hypothetical protein X777_08076 [Ooceraea biroi]RLU25575.1 hypothetical protein DMN91_001732 [Ooceraea biroi]